MACASEILSGLGYECINNIAGIKNVYIAELSSVSSLTKTSDEVTAITMVSTKKFYDFYIRPESASSFTETFNINTQNGTTFVDQVLVLDFLKKDSVKRNKIALLAEGQKRLAVIIKDYNDSLWYMGEVDGAMVSAMESVTGAAKGDRNGYTVTLSAQEKYQALPVAEAVLSTIL